LSLFSGFGLGTRLVPVMARFSPSTWPIALTAVVLTLGFPAIFSALLEAGALLYLSY
jgi:hypothetical protein